MNSPLLVVVIDLLQDVNILRPIIELAHSETSMRKLVLVSQRFRDRDFSNFWVSEITEIAENFQCEVLHFSTYLEVNQKLQKERGIIFCGSESNLNAHVVSRSILETAPSEFIRVTLQHGYECVGFLQNREQSLAFGEDIRFAADIVCSWMGGRYLKDLQPTERDKLLVTGPSSRLTAPRDMTCRRPSTSSTGLVCENLHSVRMNVVGDFKASYMDTFFAFAQQMSVAGRKVALRPHPGGQYVIKKAVTLPDNVRLENAPIYKTDLSQFAYGISAPSSVLIDMVLAGIPTAVWHDGNGQLDVERYAGLTQISSLDEWCSFANLAIEDPSPFLEKQQKFITDSGVLTNTQEVRQHFLNLLWAAGAQPIARRILFIANSEIPTLQLGFFKPLKPLIDSGVVDTLLLTEAEMRRKIKKVQENSSSVQRWINDEIENFQPDIAVFCRYSGPFYEEMVKKLRKHSVPIIYHIDDDLLNVPLEIGAAKHAEHNKPDRLKTVSGLLNSADLVYCSTENLLERFSELGFNRQKLDYGDIYCSTDIISPAVFRPVRKIGYMGFDHAHDFELIIPDLVQFLRERRDIQFELFGSIPKPAALDEFGDQVTVVPPVRPYSAFLPAFAEREWDIGLCPLAQTSFNAVKANTKWVEYSSVGAAVIATAGMAYDGCCADDCGILLNGDKGWLDALHLLCDNPQKRYQMVKNAQKKLEREYTIDRLRNQVLCKFDDAICRTNTVS